MLRASSRFPVLVLTFAFLAAFGSGCASLPWAKANTGPSGPSTVTGKVTSDRGAILADARVTLSGPSVRRTATTDITGRFTFERVPLGRYVVAASIAGFKNAKQTVQVDKEGAFSVDLRLRM